MRIGTIYSASDRALNDALNQKTVTNADLRELFLSRGILVSKESSRKTLALYFSRLGHDYRDYQRLAKLFGSQAHRERMAGTRIATEVALTTFESSAYELKAKLEQSGAIVKVYSAQGTRLDIEVKYSKVQFNKSEFRQVVNRTAVISVQREGEDLVIYAPHNEEVSEWIHELRNSASEKSGETLEFDDIELPPTLSQSEKSSFFTELIKAIPGYQLHDVSDVYVSKPKRESDDDDDGDQNGSPGTHISKASLRGQGVLQSQELKLLGAQKFYISRIIWVAKPLEPGSDLHEFEAQFSSPEECTDFTFLPRGFYKSLEGPGYSQTRTGFSSEEEKKLGRMIEAAARATLDKILEAGDVAK
ncbi:hypothetical protein [Hydrogenophaga sp.]|uniref:hypothetical protein n=1 Tax=Hydrogenophaga sp. TaxID=1904254 RepID=UPI00271BB095|nr:hypothetical protein [Hydrogenophaga sp.]MDO9504062.1 hypothetical protein [Hydrogenophaga sp.]